MRVYLEYIAEYHSILLYQTHLSLTEGNFSFDLSIERTNLNLKGFEWANFSDLQFHRSYTNNSRT